MLAVIAVIAVLARVRASARTSVAITTAVLAAAAIVGMVLQPEAGSFAVRYPGLLHFLAAPVNFLRAAFHWEHPLNVLRLTNALALPAWLFGLRPWLVRRWPDGATLVVAAWVVLQKDVLYYLTTAYLEPWALVLTLVAVELMVRDGATASWRAVLVMGAAAMIKEQALFVMPFLALPGIVHGPRRRTLVAALAAATPFTVYYAARREAEVWRTVGFSGWAEAFTAARLTAFAERVREAFGPALVIVLLLALAVLVMAVRKGAPRAAFAAIALATGFQLLFFFMERGVFEWTGYPRFLLLPVALVAAPLFLLTSRAALSAAALAVLALHGPGQAALYAEARGDDVARNFFEHRDAPVFFPVARLVGDAAAAGHLRNVTEIRALSNIHGLVAGYGVSSLPDAYPRLRPGGSWRIAPLDARTTAQCACVDPRRAPLGLFVVFNDRADLRAPREAMTRIARQCVDRMRATCDHVGIATAQGQLWGAIGIPRR